MDTNPYQSPTASLGEQPTRGWKWCVLALMLAIHFGVMAYIFKAIYARHSAAAPHPSLAAPSTLRPAHPLQP